jgi:DNA ligase-associated metallophosphoesterase
MRMRPEGAVEVLAGDETLWLLPGRAAFWARASTLLVADAHLGKAAAFRRGGIPVPQGTTESNLSRLSALMATCAAERIVFLGDLVHDGTARRAASNAFVRWRGRHRELDVMLVRGNHDRRAGDPAPPWRIQMVQEPAIEGTLALCHTPREVAGCYALAGHIHPGLRLSGPGRERLRLPCFWFTRMHAVLPAFGDFTGLADVVPNTGDRVFVDTGSAVIPLAPGCDDRP